MCGEAKNYNRWGSRPARARHLIYRQPISPNVVAEGPGAALASFFEVEILLPVSSSEARPHSATPAGEAASSAARGNNTEGAAPPPADA
jgi:hypothetical protein